MPAKKIEFDPKPGCCPLCNEQLYNTPWGAILYVHKKEKDYEMVYPICRKCYYDAVKHKPCDTCTGFPIIDIRTKPFVRPDTDEAMMKKPIVTESHIYFYDAIKCCVCRTKHPKWGEWYFFEVDREHYFICYTCHEKAVCARKIPPPQDKITGEW